MFGAYLEKYLPLWRSKFISHTHKRIFLHTIICYFANIYMGFAPPTLFVMGKVRF